MTEEYIKTVWADGDILTSAGINGIETQLEETTDSVRLMEEALEAMDISDLKYTPIQGYAAYMPSKKVTSAILKGYTDPNSGMSYCQPEMPDDFGFQYSYIKDYSLLRVSHYTGGVDVTVTINGGNMCVFEQNFSKTEFDYGVENVYTLHHSGIWILVHSECEEMELTIEGDDAIIGNFADLGHADRLKSLTFINQNHQFFRGNIGDLFEITDTLNLSGCGKLTGVYTACADVVP